jgi:hypothetical protein
VLLCLQRIKLNAAFCMILDVLSRCKKIPAC